MLCQIVPRKSVIIEAYLMQTIGMIDDDIPLETVFPPNNMIFRDIDGLPYWVSDCHPLAIGEFLDAPLVKL